MSDHTDTESSFVPAVVEVIGGLGPGEVTTYGDVAAEAGFPGAARAVGNVLGRVPDLPWWRVVTATGRLVPGHETEHARLLRSEGVDVVDGHVVLRVGGKPHPPGGRQPSGKT